MSIQPRGGRAIGTAVGVLVILGVAAAATVGALLVTGTVKLQSSGPRGPAAQYNVSFEETGLSALSQWSVDFAGSTQTSTSANISFERGTGTYKFTVSGPSGCPGWSPDPRNGTVDIVGPGTAVAVAFSGACHTSYTLSMGPPIWETTTNVSYGSFAISSVTPGLTTALFGFSISTSGGALVPVATAAATDTCYAGAVYSSTGCPAPAENWYVLLWYTGNDTVADLWVNGTWTTGLGQDYPVAISAGTLQLEVVSPPSAELYGSGDTLSAYGTSSFPVSGTSVGF